MNKGCEWDKVLITEWKEHYSNYPWIIKILANNSNGLKKESSIECFQIKSFSIERFHNKIGEIDKILLSQIHNTILKTLNPSYQTKNKLI